MDQSAHMDVDSSANISAQHDDGSVGVMVNFPRPSTQPRVWAVRRQGLCDAVPYYASFQGSLYTKNLTALGCLIDKEARINDILRAQVIITTCGGGRVVSKDETGKDIMVRASDQDEKNFAYNCFKAAKDQKDLIAMIVGRNHPQYPREVTYPYSVMDYFIVTDVWGELNQVRGKTVRVWCVRLEKANLNTHSWWDHETDHYINRSPASVATQRCEACNQDSKEIFAVGWTCLNHQCQAYFNNTQGEMLTAVEYSESFLNERRDLGEDVFDIPDILPAPPVLVGANGAPLYGTEPGFREGVVCHWCGCCSSRRYWNRWSCESEGCNWQLLSPMRVYPMTRIDAEIDVFYAAVKSALGQPTIAIKIDNAIPCRSLLYGHYNAYQYLFPNPDGAIIGSVTVFKAGEVVRRNGINAMFHTLCTANLGLSRNAARLRGNVQEIWTRHFGQNWGAFYKFGVNVQSRGFEQAPATIINACDRLKWAGKTAVPLAAQFATQIGKGGSEIHQANVEFNECLSLGYMQDDSISYHDDGEKELGPTVTTLSLGSPALMSFRPKKNSGMDALLGAKLSETYKDVLTLPLEHGDIMVMHGTLIHRFYEHMVKPHGGRRFALTCRYIDPSTIKDDTLRQEAIRQGTILSQRTAPLGYNGDLPRARLIYAPPTTTGPVNGVQKKTNGKKRYHKKRT